MKEHGLRRGARSGNGSPLTGRKIAKLPCYPQVTVSAQSNYIQSNYINGITRIRVMGKIQQKYGMTCLRIDDDQGSRRKTVMKDTEESRKKNSIFESIPKKIRL
jgi:hypothetical protein